MRMRKSLGDRSIDTPDWQQEQAKPPGPILLSFTVVAVLVWICIQRNWWPSPFGRFAWLDPLLVGAATLFAFLVVGLVWAIRTLYVIGQDQRWSWWILPAPVVVLTGAAVLNFMLPSSTFLDSRSEFEAVALELRDNRERTRETFEIGPFDIRRARASADGEVQFTDNDSMFNTTTGWVYSPDGPPAGFGESVHLDGPWYEFTSVWRD